MLAANQWDYLSVAGFHEFLQWLGLIAYVALGIVTLVLWRQRHDRPSLWVLLTFANLALISIAGRVLQLFEGEESLALDIATKILVAILVLFPYSLYRIAHAFSQGARLAHMAASIPTAIVVVWTFFLPRFPEESEPQPQALRIWAFALLFQWVLCSFLVVVRFWRAGSGQPPITRTRMRMLALAATALSVAIVISVTASDMQEGSVTDVVTDLISLLSAVAFFFAFAPPAWLRASWRRGSEEDARRAMLDLMGAITDEAVVNALLPHAATVVGAEAIAIFDTEGTLIGTHGGGEKSSWAGRSTEDEEMLQDAGITKLTFPFGCLLIKTTPYTMFFGRDEVELVGALGVMTNLALERVRASEMRMELAEAQIRRQQALEINDNIVQGLAVAKYAFDLGENEKAKSAIEGTLAAARRIISDLLEEVEADEVFGPNALTRDTPATGFVKKQA